MSRLLFVGISACFSFSSFLLAQKVVSQEPSSIVRFSQRKYSVNENSFDSKAKIILERTGELENQSTVKINIVDSPEYTLGEDDYDKEKIMFPLTVTFEKNQGVKVIEIPIIDDEELEEPETLLLELIKDDNDADTKISTVNNQAILEVNDIDTSQLPRAIRLELVNGVIKYVNGAQKARVDLEWSLLPLSEELKDARLNFYPESEAVTCKIRNTDLGTEKWIKKLSGKCKERLTEALMIDNLNCLLPSEAFSENAQPQSCSTEEFAEYWSSKDGEGFNLIKTADIQPRQFYGHIRDHLIMKFLLQSSGINYSFDVNGEPQPQGDFPRISDENITWEIKIYKVDRVKTVDEVEKNFLYRYTAKADIEPFDLIFPFSRNTENTKNSDKEKENNKSQEQTEGPKATVKIRWKGSSSTIGILDPKLKFGEIDLKIVSAREETINELADNASNELVTILGYFTGNNDLGAITASNFLGEAENANIITGGLISDEFVDPLVGVDVKLTDIGSAQGGLIVGIGVDNNNPLYVGPSFSYSILSLSAGVRIADRNNNTELDPSGLISFDLSQLIGGKSQKTELIVDDAKVGGNWGKASDKVAKNTTLVIWPDRGVTEDPFKNWNDDIFLVKVKDCNGNETMEAEKAKIPKPAENTLFQFVPLGQYNYQKSNGDSIDLGLPISICESDKVKIVQSNELP